MRVLLVNPFQGRLVNRKGRIYNRTWQPLDLANCGAILENAGIDVSILDANAEQLGPERVARRAMGYHKVFITSTSLDRWQCPSLDISPFLDTVSKLKKVVPEVYIAGSHGTVRPVEMLQATGACAVIRGEPEYTILDLCNNHTFSETSGITYRSGNKIIENPDQKLVDLNELPIPAFHLLPMNKYYYEMVGDNFCILEMTRGCTSDCSFCLLKPYGHGVRKKSVDKLIRELEHVINSFGTRNIYFIDLEFTVFRKQVIEFCKYIDKKNYQISWCCQTRFDLVDDELLSYMKKAGCRLIHFGVEAGSDRILKTINKGITMDEIRKGMKQVKTAGIDTACFFMIGFPESDRQDMRDIVKFAYELWPDYPLFHIVSPYPGTKLFEKTESNPGLRFSDNTLFPEAVINDITLEELKTLTKKAYINYYLRPSYVFSRLTKGHFKTLRRQFKLFWSFVRN
ncbi:Fe-S oxidoreductase [Candidatus Scalindua japonica]|uniref:Fe-S oxidoreductase n=1 Tax=Candidatus Scalindua japonica TaxID=1284222 RepID=A0A286TX24_9BACT|nr:radical SAM protein [Candidatus Scalindua japonica]GAX60432.1 Fe-S oxidoreductase [Candidatus Scalindua japonica]